MQTCRLRGGRTLEYREFGEADGKAVVYGLGTVRPHRRLRGWQAWAGTWRS